MTVCNEYFNYDPPPLPSWALPEGTPQAPKQAVKPTKQEKTPEAPPKQEKTQEEIDKDLAVREMRSCKNKNPILFDIVADNLSIKGKKPDDLSLYQCNQFIDECVLPLDVGQNCDDIDISENIVDKKEILISTDLFGRIIRESAGGFQVDKYTDGTLTKKYILKQ